MYLAFLSEEIRMDKEVSKIYHVFVRDVCDLEKITHAEGRLCLGESCYWLWGVLSVSVPWMTSELRPEDSEERGLWMDS